tara:strand:- start:27 stop:275 length:249 start_codon:yes stop_codon:yes gene_type:complete
MLINLLDFSNCSWVLEVSNWLFLDGKDNTVFTLESDSSSTSIHGFKSVFYLEQFTVWSKNSYGFIVSWHDFFKLIIYINQKY